MRPTVRNRVREVRRAAAVSQDALAHRVGVSRQALSAIESGRQVPSTALALAIARVLGHQVEELFTLADGPPIEARLPDSVVVGLDPERVALASVEGSWVAHPLASDTSTPATGLLVGPGGSPGTGRVLPSDPSDAATQVLVAGCAPLLDLLSRHVRGARGDASATWLPTNSRAALDLLRNRLVHAAGIHLAAGRSADEHARIVRDTFPGESMVIVHLTRWVQGLVVPSGNPHGIVEAGDVTRPGIKVARREAGAGAYELLERITRAGGVEPEGLTGPLVTDHRSVARSVRWSAAHTGITTEGAAIEEGLDFVPLMEQRFDLVVRASQLSEQPVSRLLETLTSGRFRKEARVVPGYDTATLGDTFPVEPPPSHEPTSPRS